MPARWPWLHLPPFLLWVESSKSPFALFSPLVCWWSCHNWPCEVSWWILSRFSVCPLSGDFPGEWFSHEQNSMNCLESRPRDRTGVSFLLRPAHTEVARGGGYGCYFRCLCTHIIIPSPLSDCIVFPGHWVCADEWCWSTLSQSISFSLFF